MKPLEQTPLSYIRFSSFPQFLWVPETLGKQATSKNGTRQPRPAPCNILKPCSAACFVS